MQTTPVSTDISPARPSSTVILVRDGKSAPEILMVKRHERSSFGSAYAFPGGVLESDDGKVHHVCEGRSQAEANKSLALEDGALDYFSAAVREVFEETGILLGAVASVAEDLDQARLRLIDGSLSWEAFAIDSGLRIGCNQLHYFSYWVTPVQLAMRYSTRFFLAHLPAGQRAEHCGGEITDSCWISATAALAEGVCGSKRIHYPTRKTLESIAGLESAAEMIAWARACECRGVECIQPSVVPASER